MRRRYAIRRLLKRDLPAFSRILSRYLWRRLVILAGWITTAALKTGEALEQTKNSAVATLLWKRGALRRPIVHFGMASLVSAILMLSGASFGSGLIATTYPGVPSDLSFPDETWETAISNAEVLGLAVSLETIRSEKPRDAVIQYKVVDGDTVSTIAEKFGIDVATIQWANSDINDINDIMPGDILDILPVSGVAHHVEAGDTIYSIAEEYGLKDEATDYINAQPVINWPFNEIGDDLSLKIGQVLIVPGGMIEEEEPWVAPTPAGLHPPTLVPTHQGLFAWPFPGGCAVSQWPAWYHLAIDCTNPIGTPVSAAGRGVVSQVSALGWGYGSHVIVDHGNGLQTLYAHLSGFNVGVGDAVAPGGTVGWVGMTGRTTGPHLHFEVRQNGAVVNPLNYLP